MSNVTNYLTPEEINAYQTRINNADLAAQRGLTKLGTRRQEATADFNTAYGRLGTQWDNYQRTLPNSFARRNVLRSGIMNRAINDYGTNRANAFGDLQRTSDRQMGGYAENQGDIEMMLKMNRDQVKSERMARQQAATADAIRAQM
jgi:hypothetical protein